MDLMQKIWSTAQKDIKRIVLPEGEEERTIAASEVIKKNALADVILIGNENVINEKPNKLGVSSSKLQVKFFKF